MVSVRAVLMVGGRALADAGAECGGEGMAKWLAAVATSLLEDEMDEPGVVGVAGDWTAADEFTTL